MQLQQSDTDSCKQGKVSYCGQHSDIQNDPCIFQMTRRLHVALPAWCGSTLQMLSKACSAVELDYKFVLCVKIYVMKSNTQDYKDPIKS